MTRRAWLLFSALGAIWGLPYLLIKVAVREVPPGGVVFARTAIAALVLLPFAWRVTVPSQLRARIIPLAGYTLAEVLVPWPMLFRAEEHLSSSFSALVIAAAPLFGVGLLVLLGEEHDFGWRRLAGLLVGFGGVGLIVGGRLRGGDLAGVGELLLAALGYAVGPILVSRHLSDLPRLSVVTASLVLSAVVSAPFALTNLPRHLDPRPAAAVVTLAVVCTAIGFSVLFALVAEAGPARAVVVNYVNPAVAAALGVGLLGESFTPAMAGGIVAVVAGCVLSTAGGLGPGGGGRRLGVGAAG